MDEETKKKKWQSHLSILSSRFNYEQIQGKYQYELNAVNLVNE